MLNESGRVPDTRYEWKAVTLLSLGFGLVGLDRFMVIPMFPALVKDLGLNYQDLGHITGALAITWGVSAILMGRITDKIGPRKVVAGALVIFSLLAGFHGLAAGIGSLILIRALMGVFEGAYTPAAIVATLEASAPQRHGRNLGIQQAALPLFGLAVAPILITQLLQIIEWRTIFFLLAIPGLIIAFLLFRVLRDPVVSEIKVHTSVEPVGSGRWQEIFRYRNIPLNIANMFCWLTCLIVTSAMFPSYLIDYIHLDMLQMGFVLSAIGFGAAAGTIVMPTLSDRLGRKPVMLVSVIGAIVFLIGLINVGADPTLLFVMLFGTCFFNFSMICLTVGPLSAESVPPQLMTTASGMVVGIGEIFGGGIAPIVAGYVAQHFGIQYTLYLALGGLALGFFVILALKETAPRKLAPVVTPAEAQEARQGMSRNSI
ncbi:MFS transporter [Rhizobium sp. AG855]|uniref:MFS transporter n=1 Tax=Rhizobium sp. AG855 TaxID=2183898 RepID=UPI000E74D20D|nr:MFS transporter [Rhizobium sp. AG855]RKE76993.1 sugar phosphate permease [Rhizobium sp. AG855]